MDVATQVRRPGLPVDRFEAVETIESYDGVTFLVEHVLAGVGELTAAELGVRLGGTWAAAEFPRSGIVVFRRISSQPIDEVRPGPLA